MFTRLEVEALVLGLAEVTLSGDPMLAKAAAGGAGQDHRHPARPGAAPGDPCGQPVLSLTNRRKPAPAHLHLVREAAWEERAVDLSYSDLSSRQTRRRIWPLGTVFLDREVVCLAFCCLRQDFRRFKLAQMQDVRLAEESFRPRRVPLLRAYLERLRAEGPGGGSA
jgi:predicted DNA-binding transcriptional regulator YafY